MGTGARSRLGHTTNGCLGVMTQGTIPYSIESWEEKKLVVD